MSEQEYLRIARRVLYDGKPREDRTGTGTISLFGEQMRFDISKYVPLLTTKFVPWKAVIKELLWMCRGETDAGILQKQGVNIWNGNTSRAFLDSRGLNDLPEGDIGGGYGHVWRYCGATYKTCKDDYTGQGVDQLAAIEESLKNDPMSRRHFMTAWNPPALNRMALPPCHLSVQFYVETDSSGTKHLSAHMYQRSVDVFLGSPFNVFSYTVLTYILAKRCGMMPKELIISMGDTHIYKDHIRCVEEQLSRPLFAPPQLIIDDSVATKDWKDITIDDFKICNYEYHPAIKAAMSV
jgi:thymidylate synthase